MVKVALELYFIKLNHYIYESVNIHGLKLINNHSKPPFTFYLLYFFTNYIATNTECSEIKIFLKSHIEEYLWRLHLEIL